MTGAASRPELRIGDAERDAAVEALGEHYLVGRLTKDEYDERAALAWAARTAAQLRPLFADLPRSSTGVGALDDAVRATAPPTGPSRFVRDGWSLLRAHPLLAVLVAFLVVSHLPVLLVVALVWLLWSRTPRDGRRPQMSGSVFDVRGRCS